MDELAKRLREDAARIDAEVSPELDQRISASLAATRPARDKARSPRVIGLPMWLASSLTGVAATAVVIIAINVGRDPNPAPDVTAEAPPVIPAVELEVVPAMLTGPLQEEMDALRSDLEKAEQAVREDIGLIL